MGDVDNGEEMHVPGQGINTQHISVFTLNFVMNLKTIFKNQLKNTNKPI